MNGSGTDPTALQPGEPTPSPGPAPSDDADPARARIRQVVVHYVPIIRWLPAYPRDWLRPDLVAALTSWGVMVPVALAYAGLAGVPPESGLVTAFAALTAYAVFGTSRHLKVTDQLDDGDHVGLGRRPTSRAATRTAYLALTAALALMVGAILLARPGSLGSGFIADFLTKSVVTGFIFGLAITIIVGQLPKLLGVPGGGERHDRAGRPGPGRQPARHQPVHARGRGSAPSSSSWCCGAISRRIPGPLIALVLGIVAVAAFDLEVHGVSVVGEIATGIPLPGLPNVPLPRPPVPRRGRRRDRVPRRRASRSEPGAPSRRGTSTRSTPTRSCVALGAANLSSGLFGGFTTDASLSQTATAESAGTPLAALVARHGGAHPRDRRAARAAVREPAQRRPRRDRHRGGPGPDGRRRDAALLGAGGGRTSSSRWWPSSASCSRPSWSAW